MRRQRLSFQVVAGFVLLVILTAGAVGLPAIWIIRSQLDQQAWLLLEQGSHTTQALYAARKSEMTTLAILTTQRPTLRRLVTANDQAALPDYLATLQTGAGLDLLLVCDERDQVLSYAGLFPAADLCQIDTAAGFYTLAGAAGAQAWLLARQPVQSEPPAGSVVVGYILDERVIRQIGEQSGLGQFLLLNDRVLAASLADLPAAQTALEDSSSAARLVGEETLHRRQFAIDGRPYYALHFLLDQSGLEKIVAIDMSDMVSAQRRLIWLTATGILIVAAIGSAAGGFLARRIGRPLDELAQAASNLSWHELDKPVRIKTSVSEVAQVAQALEFTRVELQQTLADLQREKDWVDHLLASIVEGIMTLDSQGRVVFFSQGAERITGWRRADVIGRPCDEIFQMAESERPFSQFIPESGEKRKVSVRLAGDKQATLAVTGAQLMPPAAGRAEVALVFRDVSEEETMHRLLAHFLANVAHEFRTPLSALAASIELLLDQSPDLTPAEFQELLNSLHLGILGLQTLVDNLLESASIESGHFRVFVRPVDLKGVMMEAVQTMRPLIEKHGQELRLELPAALPTVQADSRRILQVLVNLLSNAIKHGPDEAEITLSARQVDGRIQIAVADAGPGVPDEYRDDLFYWFMRRRPEQGKAPFGVGLGLAVVKAVVQAHGGRVGVEDRPAGGSRFWFELPVNV